MQLASTIDGLMMILLTRFFRSEPRLERDLLESLGRVAATIVKSGEAQSVLICQRSDDLRQFIWIETQGQAARATRGLISETAWAAAGQALRHDLKRLRFVDGVCRFPSGRTSLWAFEVRVPIDAESRTLEELLHALRVAFDSLRLVSMSLYRVVDEPGHVFGFLALSQGVEPRDLLTRAVTRRPGPPTLPQIAYYRIAVVSAVGRLISASSPVLSAAQYPRTLGWARSGDAPDAREPGGSSLDEAEPVPDLHGSHRASGSP